MLSNYATNFAIIDKSNDIVTNIIWGCVYNESEWNTQTQYTVQIDDLNVNIGDSYSTEDMKFFQNGEEVKSKRKTMNEMLDDIHELTEIIFDG